MSDSEEDTELKRAIALSLQEQADSKQIEIIDLDSEPDKPVEVPPKPRNQPDTGPITQQHLNSMLGLDRKAMEAERLARKRKLVSISPPPTRKTVKTTHPQPGSPAAPIANTPSIMETTAGSSKSAVNLKIKGLISPHGTIKKTWAYNHPRTGDDITIEEVLQRSDLTLAVLSSFQWDFDWLIPKLDAKRTQMVFVMQAKTERHKQQYLDDFAGISNVRLCFPPMEGQVNCMHSKLMLLSHPGYLRVAVPTANLMSYDWGEDGVMENSVFLIDLPRLPDGQTTELADMTNFGRELLFFLHAMGLERKIITSISNFDFSATHDIAFVHTIGGGHISNATTSTSKPLVNDTPSVDAFSRTGFNGLHRAVTELGLATDQQITVDYVTSSIGSLNVHFLAILYHAARGDGTNLSPYKKSKLSSSRANSTDTSSENQLRDSLSSNFHIYYPTYDTVKTSTGGPPCGGTICFQSAWYNAPTFPRLCLHDCKSVRQGLLMHNKIIYVRHLSTTRDDDAAKNEDDLGNHPKLETQATGDGCNKDTESRAWVYIGSANCSESAWGRIGKEKNTGREKLNCRNWECGVVVPVKRGARVKQDEGAGEEGVESLELFNGLVPVPMVYPGEEYGEKKPWCGAFN